MLADITGVDAIYIICGYTDMRKAIDGLYSIIKDQLAMDPKSDAMFLFCGKRRDRIKVLRRFSEQTSWNGVRRNCRMGHVSEVLQLRSALPAGIRQETPVCIRQ